MSAPRVLLAGSIALASAGSHVVASAAIAITMIALALAIIFVTSIPSKRRFSSVDFAIDVALIFGATMTMGTVAGLLLITVFAIQYKRENDHETNKKANRE
jgi:uncharacterized membrane protein